MTVGWNPGHVGAGTIPIPVVVNVVYSMTNALKDQSKKEEVSRVVYQIKRGRGEETCGRTYTGETDRTLKTRAAENRWPSSTSSEVSQHLHLQWRQPH